MSTGMFTEAINSQTFLQHLLGYSCKTKYSQDNEALLTILADGYSSQLRHCGRVHRINIPGRLHVGYYVELVAC